MQLNEHTNKQFISKLPKRGNNVQKTRNKYVTGQDRTGQGRKENSRLSSSV